MPLPVEGSRDTSKGQGKCLPSSWGMERHSG